MKVLVAPVQDGFVPEVKETDTPGATAELMVMVIELDVAGLPVTPDRLEVITQVTTCPLVSDAVL